MIPGTSLVYKWNIGHRRDKSFRVGEGGATIDLAVIVTPTRVKTWTCGLYRQWVTAISSFLSYGLWDSNKILNSKMDSQSIHRRDCVAGRVANWGELRSSDYLSIWYAGLRDDFHMRGLLSANICQRVYISQNRRKRLKSTSRIVFANHVEFWRDLCYTLTILYFNDLRSKRTANCQ